METHQVKLLTISLSVVNTCRVHVFKLIHGKHVYILIEAHHVRIVFSVYLCGY